jgi:hypothetical protein
MTKRPLRAWMRDKLLNHVKETVVPAPDGGIAEFTFSKDDIPMTPSNMGYRPIFLGDARTYAAIGAWDAAENAYEIEHQKRIDCYQTLVRSATSLDDVIEVWPEAAILVPAREITATLAPEQIAIIKADMRERKAT